MDHWEEKMLDFVRRGEGAKAQFLEKEMQNRILPSQLERIRQNDKTVLKELVLPAWLDWDMLYEWSYRIRLPPKGVQCILCNSYTEKGKTFEEKFVCEECILRVKNL